MGGGERARREAPAARVPLYRLFAFADRTDVALMAVGTVAAVANGMARPVMTHIFGDVVNAFSSAGFSPDSDVLHRVSKIIINFVYLGIGAGLVSALQVSCWTITGERQAARIRAQYLKAILRQNIAFFDKEMSTGQVVERMCGDTFLIQDAIGEKIGKYIQLLSTFFGGFIIAFVRGWLLTLVMLSSIPPVVVAGFIVSRIQTNLSTQMQANYGDAADIVEKTIGTIRTVVSFNGENQAITTYNKFVRNAYECALREGAVVGLGLGPVTGTLFCTYGLAVWYGAKLIVDGGYNGGIIINVMLAVFSGALSLSLATSSITAFAGGQGAAYRIFKTIEREPDIDVYDKKGIILEDIKGDVELKDVYLSYPTRPDHLVLNGFSLRVRSGTTMALVGGSGGGKSTVVSLVERFYDPLSGEVLIDGVDIRRMNLGWIRGNIGLVSQEPVLFSSTIRENIAYGKDGLTLAEIKRAIEFANAENFIAKLPNVQCIIKTSIILILLLSRTLLLRTIYFETLQGLETMVGERGTQLSGGQKQRIAIARAIIKNPRILLLDEATSALDMESERIVQDALDIIMLERTTIIVAHRLSTIKNADVICVLQHGNIVEQGIPSIFIYKATDSDYKYQCVHMYNCGALGAKLSTDAQNVKRLVGDNLALNIQTVSTIMSGFTIAMMANWKLALIITVVIPFFGFQTYAQTKFLQGRHKNAKLKYEEASQVACDAVGGIRTVASLCAEQKVMDAYEKKCESPTRQGMREGVVGGMGFGFTFLVFYLAYALCFYVGAKFVQEGTATFPEVNGFVGYFQVFFVLVLASGSISRGSASGADGAKANASAISLFEILDRKSKIDSSSEEGMVIASARGDIEFQNTAALVGESGGGKSTAIALLERFYDPTSGKILFDSVELGTLKVSWLRQQIGLVAQEPVLFNDTIRANIAYGKQGEASEEEIVAAAEAANAHRFISGLPDGYDTVVGERGIQLSGGQKQRVAIARAVVKDPKVLLLDEATSSLDAESERVVQEALDRVMVGRTTLVVAHRLLTVRGADIICMVQSGTITEKGRHDQLMQIKDGAYASLVELSYAEKGGI
ncbi:ABC transporter B family member 11-like [Triticum urartu]|uniref:ABC transporter B family member 11-like n=1 Tax=Triticum urartu TaxID=4572 RepID=UPI002043D03B|nr:ABC transporter B family member 11-like [Triticum urartu]